ncbi:anti-sigma factor domain-containing protein [Bacillus sp. sid0103]|uniref:anti-sigma factor domain-containing protein n=1 Tax=Bacillus sp. sid0103 TaxID=2856337 RepID=UPI001C44C05A|nr:anti-sigma factor domain-containing protein [Bacillus sp. sid0103]MBV7503970.1 anti-sigma factor domain-containing protein [Bacillus sp. sid0103]
MKKGIIMDIDDEFLTLLTPEGEFLHTRRQNQPYAVGEEIHFFPIERVKTSNPFHPLKTILKYKPVWALMAAFVILFSSFFTMYQNNKAYAYMSIDVNPSIELGVNKKMQVVGITGNNKEGKKIVSHLKNWKMENVSKVAQTILVELNKEGYLNSNEEVIISTVRTKEPEVNVEKKLKENIEVIKASVAKKKVDLTFQNATLEEREKAHKTGTSIVKNRDRKTKTSLNQTNKVKTKDNQSKTENKATITKPNKSIPSELIKKQTENKALQNKNNDLKKKSEKKWINGKSNAPGQLKKIEEKQFKQNQWQHKNQINKREKRAENKKSLNREDNKKEDNKKEDNKKEGNKKEDNKKEDNESKEHKWKDRNTNTGKNNNYQNNNESKWKNKEKDKHKQDGRQSKKSYGNHWSNQKYR